MKNICKMLLPSLLCLLFLASCAETPPVVAGDAYEEESTIVFDPEKDMTTTKSISDVTCTVLQKDGSVSGFEMRFHKTPTLDSMLSSPENVYFSVLTKGSKKIVVSTELVRVLSDVGTGEYEITILLPSGKKCEKGEWNVGFYISSRSGDLYKAMISAEKTVSVG